MLDINKVITVATAEVGYKEKKGNITKYADFFDKKYPEFYNYRKQGAEWCDLFYDFIIVKSYEALGIEKCAKILYQPLHSCGAGCSFSHGYYKEHNAVGSTPKVGAQVFFKNKDNKIVHTGLVIKIDKTHFYTIEGNKNNSVQECKYPLNSKKVHSFGYPNYEGYTLPVEEKPKEEKPKDKEKSFDVKVIAKSGLYVRKESNTKCTPLYVLPYKGVVTVTKYNNDWYKTRDGFISSKWCEIIGD